MMPDMGQLNHCVVLGTKSGAVQDLKWGNFFLKIGKIHAIYVYIKNQKQTDELPKSQVGCVLGEVCFKYLFSLSSILTR